MPLGPGSRLDVYEIVAPLGTGGMGEVWLARDLKLERQVAIKVLPPDLTQDTHRVARFQHEARAASGLNHPNVCTIHALGEAPDGQQFIAMEYVEGDTLRHGVGHLAPRDALDIAIQVASALTAAHAAGVVHRDLKPENVIRRPDGFVKVLDFGLAKLVATSPSDEPAATRTMVHTEAGTVLGTVAYMSPEQVRGREVDQRTDIWSLGVMLYEMVAGRCPFTGQSRSEVLAAILDREPAPLARFDPNVPSELQRIVGKALRKDREQRYQGMKDLLLDLQALRHDLEVKAANSDGWDESTGPAAALIAPAAAPTPVSVTPTGAAQTSDGAAPSSASIHEPPPIAPVATRLPLISWRLLAAGMVIGALGLALAAERGWLGAHPFSFGGGSPPPPIRSLAVLSLDNLSADPEQEYFADGMTEALSTRLSGLHGLRVISRTSVMQFKGGRKPVPEIARALNVDAVVVGSVQRAGGRVRISAQLIRGELDETLWSGSYDREVRDILALQSELAQIIAQQIDVTVTGVERQRLAAGRVVSPDVYDTYLKGLFELSKGSRVSSEASIAYFEAAIARDGTFAPAYEGLGQAYDSLGSLTVGARPASALRPKAFASVRQALKLDPDLASSHEALASLEEEEWHWAEAEAEYRRALELNPSLASAHAGLGWWLVCQGRTEEAIASSLRARYLDPLSLRLRVSLGVTLYAARRQNDAIRELRGALETRPDADDALGILGLALVEVGQFDESIRVLVRAVSLSDRNPWHLGMLANAYARGGHRPEALRIVDELRRLRTTRYVTPGAFVYALMGLGDHEGALAALEDGYAERANIMKFLKVNPIFDPLRTDPRFVSLVHRVGLD